MLCHNLLVFRLSCMGSLSHPPAPLCLNHIFCRSIIRNVSSVDFLFAWVLFYLERRVIEWWGFKRSAACCHIIVVNLPFFRNKGAWIVKFYAQWCVHCQEMAETWKEFALRCRERANVGEVCSKHALRCRECAQVREVCSKQALRCRKRWGGIFKASTKMQWAFSRWGGMFKANIKM